jgi:hypothetical protein
VKVKTGLQRALGKKDKPVYPMTLVTAVAFTIVLYYMADIIHIFCSISPLLGLRDVASSQIFCKIKEIIKLDKAFTK